MTVKELMQTAEGHPALQDAIANGAHVWNSDACIGYVINALEKLNYPPEEMRRIVRSMWVVFSQIGIDEAAQHYKNSRY